MERPKRGSASKIGSSTSIAAVMQTRSGKVEMPSGLSLPLAFGMKTRLIGSGRVAASMRKGIWMGGAVPLGYRIEDRALHVVEDEAEFAVREGKKHLISRSNWAKDSSMFRVSRPILVVVLKAWVTEMKETPCASNSSTSLAKSASDRVSRSTL